MKLSEVESSNIAAMGHDYKNNVLRVVFKRGGTYDYENVPMKLFDDILAAESVGKAFHSNIKTQPGSYPFKKVA